MRVQSFPQDKEVLWDPQGNEMSGGSSNSCFLSFRFRNSLFWLGWVVGVLPMRYLSRLWASPRVPSSPCLSIVDLASLFIFKGCHNKVLQTGGLETEIYPLTFWSLDV